MKTATVIGFKTPEDQERFHDSMEDKVKNYEDWDREAVENEVFTLAQTALEAKETIIYELSANYTKSNSTEDIWLFEDEFEVEWKDEEE